MNRCKPSFPLFHFLICRLLAVCVVNILRKFFKVVVLSGSYVCSMPNCLRKTYNQMQKYQFKCTFRTDLLRHIFFPHPKLLFINHQLSHDKLIAFCKSYMYLLTLTTDTGFCTVCYLKAISQWHTANTYEVFTFHAHDIGNIQQYVTAMYTLNRGVSFWRNCVASSVGSKTRWFGFINWVDNVNWPPERDSKADVSSVTPSSELIWRANAQNVSFKISLRWPIHIINPVDKTKLSMYFLIPDTGFTVCYLRAMFTVTHSKCMRSLHLLYPRHRKCRALCESYANVSPQKRPFLCYVKAMFHSHIVNT